MTLSHELRSRAPQALLTGFGICAVIYFAYHGISGDRGLFAWRALEQEVADARTQLQEVQDERKALEARVKLLYPESLDADMLEEWARRLLNYGLPDEAVVLDGDEDETALQAPALQTPLPEVPVEQSEEPRVR